MPSSSERKGRFAGLRPSYTTRVHLKRRLGAIDFRFLAAAAALAVATAGIVRYL